MENSAGRCRHQAKMVRLKRHCCTLPFLFKCCVALLAISSVLLLLQSIWGSRSAVERPGDTAGKTGRLTSSNINSGIFIQREYLPKQGSDSHSSDCEVPRFNSNSTVPPEVVCRRIPPRPGSCQLARELYSSDKLKTCSHQEKYQLCQIKGEGNEMTVECDQEVCPGPVSLGTINPAIGVLHWEELSNMKEVQAHLQHLLQTGKPEAVFGFCFIKCPLLLQEVQEGGQQGAEDGPEYQEGDVLEDDEAEGLENSFQAFDKNYFQEETDDEPWAQQLLLIPPKQQNLKPSNSSPGLNVNVILLDSVSHSHFYRSLPRTVHTFREINRMKAATLFNYNLMQSLKGRTYENLQMLFSGVMYNPEEPFGVRDMPPDPVGTRALLEGFKHMGYETLWMEDLCWTWEWGIAKNFVVHSPNEMLSFRWKKLQDAMKEGGVDQLGLGLASCEILHSNNHNDPFHGPPAICYNGEYQHAYMLQYLKGLQKSHQSSKTPFFHYTEMNVAHDDFGVRVQGLDKSLADYLTFAASLDNTMTIILADHGNAYGSFIHKSEEGRIEMFHPALFIMLSKDAGRFLSPSQVAALRANQDRLTSIIDLHYMLRSLAYPGLVPKVAMSHQHFDVNPVGLLQEVSKNRTCDHIPRIQPNVCICEDYDSRVPNDTSRLIFAEFALGELNNAIQNQFVEAHPEAKRGFGRCRPLQAMWFTNVRENYHGDDTIIVKLDLYVKAGLNASQAEEVFFVTLLASTKSHSGEQLRLLSYERLTAYSPYEKCVDKGVATKLCVCSLAWSESSKKAVDYSIMPRWHDTPSFFKGHASTVKEVTSCLYLYERRTPNGVVLEASCECREKLYLVEINAKSQNIITSKELPVKIILKPGMRTFLVAFVQSVQRRTWSLEYSVQYTEHRLF